MNKNKTFLEKNISHTITSIYLVELFPSIRNF